MTMTNTYTLNLHQSPTPITKEVHSYQTLSFRCSDEYGTSVLLHLAGGQHLKVNITPDFIEQPTVQITMYPEGRQA